MSITELADVGLHRPSHSCLIQLTEPLIAPIDADTKLDAIIVPAARPVKNLTSAIALARALDAHLLVLCSKLARAVDAQALFNEWDFRNGVAVAVPEWYDHPLLALETSEWARTGFGNHVWSGRHIDLSVKRNVGLLIARMLRWERIFFLDDDIREISADALADAVSLLGRSGQGNRSVGLRVPRFPDNSVVCHARRMAGAEQDVFVSGSALAVDCTAPFAFFPSVYNEDWLFFYRDVAAGRLASLRSPAAQVEYNPFADPRRAASEEFGDVIAEGLYALLHLHRGLGSATPKYWSVFLRSRYSLLDEIRTRLDRTTTRQRDEIGAALDAARRELRDITPEMCTSYLTAWQEDLRRWELVRDRLPLAGSVANALRELNLQPARSPAQAA